MGGGGLRGGGRKSVKRTKKKTISNNEVGKTKKNNKHLVGGAAGKEPAQAEGWYVYTDDKPLKYYGYGKEILTQSQYDNKKNEETREIIEQSDAAGKPKGDKPGGELAFTIINGKKVFNIDRSKSIKNVTEISVLKKHDLFYVKDGKITIINLSLLRISIPLTTLNQDQKKNQLSGVEETIDNPLIRRLIKKDSIYDKYNKENDEFLGLQQNLADEAFNREEAAAREAEGSSDFGF